MADERSLRMIGFGLSAITFAVTFVAMVLVADATHTAHDTTSVVASAGQ
jgi:hypothetical protein